MLHYIYNNSLWNTYFKDCIILQKQFDFASLKLIDNIKANWQKLFKLFCHIYNIRFLIRIGIHL